MPFIPLFIQVCGRETALSCFCKQILLLESLPKKDQVVKQQGGIAPQSNPLWNHGTYLHSDSWIRERSSEILAI